jgi:mono/diheme cytochrome c family protein
MRRRRLTLAVSALAFVGAGFAAGCGSEGTTTPSPQTVVGSVPHQPTTTTPAKGNPALGKPVFLSNGCGGCHTYTPAGTNGTVGPDLDKLPDYARKAGQPLDEFTSGAITSPPPKYVPPGYPTNVMPTNFGQTIKPQDLANLVAFLTQKS